MKRGHLAEAVTGDAVRTDPHRMKNVGERHALHAERWLRPLGRRELLRLRVARGVGEDRPREDDVVQRFAAELLRSSGVPGGARGVERHRDVGAHAHVLTALPRVEERNLAGVRAAGRVVNAVQADEQVRKIEISEYGTHHWHDDVGNQRIDNLAERAADYHAYR